MSYVGFALRKGTFVQRPPALPDPFVTAERMAIDTRSANV
jgi:hypothetical protein